MDQVKVALIEQKLDDLKPIIVKLDSAIEKLSEVNISVTEYMYMKNEFRNKKRLTLYSLKIDKLRDKMDLDHDSVLSRLRGLEKRVWMVVGGLTVLSFTINSPLVANILTPTPQPPTIERGS